MNYINYSVSEVAENPEKVAVTVHAVLSAYTSIIGKLKYKKTYGISDHQAAALIIERRGLGYTEKVPKVLKKISPRAILYYMPCTRLILEG
ncbi:MAG: hypothetical protein ACE5J3_00745 [Methanosarcinales archaeon]